MINLIVQRASGKFRTLSNKSLFNVNAKTYSKPKRLKQHQRTVLLLKMVVGSYKISKLRELVNLGTNKTVCWKKTLQ